jgi:hypothetical protein
MGDAKHRLPNEKSAERDSDAAHPTLVPHVPHQSAEIQGKQRQSMK